jgi:hypothetical protein
LEQGPIVNEQYRAAFRIMVWFPLIYTALFLLLGVFGLDTWLLQFFDTKSFWLYDWIPLARSYRSYLTSTEYQDNLPLIMHLATVQLLATLCAFCVLLIARIKNRSTFLTRSSDRHLHLGWSFDVLGFFVLGILFLVITRGVPESVDSTRVMNSYHPERGGLSLIWQSLLHTTFFILLFCWLELRLLEKYFTKEEPTI